MESMTSKQIRDLIEAGKAYKVPENELAIYYENMEHRENLQPEGIKNLYKAICYKAIVDYRAARKYIASGKKRFLKQKRQEKQNIETFFDSDFFKDVSGCNSKDRVIKAVDSMMAREATKGMIKG